MEEQLQQIGKRLYERRKHLRMSQDELAELAGITPQTVSTAELDKKAMRIDTAIRLCAALQISPDYLLLGAVSDTDVFFLKQTTSDLTPCQYFHLEEIVNNYVTALQNKEMPRK